MTYGELKAGKIALNDLNFYYSILKNNIINKLNESNVEITDEVLAYSLKTVLAAKMSNEKEFKKEISQLRIDEEIK